MIEFEALGLFKNLLTSIATLGYETPTPIQRGAIPLVLAGRDIVGLAQTGTGKTAAFGLPLVQNLSKHGLRPAPKTVRALILAPTRELVNQIAGNLRDFVRRTPIRVAAVVGGASINVQTKELQRGIDILVATPGRLLDLIERRAVSLGEVKFLVLDEADQMLDLGFIHALKRIARLVGSPRQTLLFSATMPKQIEELGKAYLTDPEKVEVSPPGRTADKVGQSVHFIDRGGKAGLLKSLLSERPEDLSLVFARTKHGAEKLMKQLVAAGFRAGSIHGNKSQGQRDRAIKAFRSGEMRVLVATDVAARGIDIPGVSHVYNFDLPEVAESYVHRIGRTARAGAEGKAVAFCAEDEVHLLRGIEKLTGNPIEVASGVRPERGQSQSAARRPQGRRPAGAAPSSAAPRGGAQQRPAPKQGDRKQGDHKQQAPRKAANANTKGRPKWRRRARPAA